MLWEILIGVVIAIAFLGAAIAFAFKTPNLKGPSRHTVRGNGDYADSQVHSNRGFDGSGDGGDGGGD